MKFSIEVLLLEKQTHINSLQAKQKGEEKLKDKPKPRHHHHKEKSIQKGVDKMMKPPYGEKPWEEKKDHDRKKHDDKKCDDKKCDDKKHDDKKKHDYASYIPITEQGKFAGIARNQNIIFTLKYSVPFNGDPAYGTFQGLIKDKTGVYALILVGTELYRLDVQDFVTVV